MNSTLKLTTLLGLTALALAPLARAEDQPATPPAPDAPATSPGGKHGHRGDRAAHRLQMLDEKLHLTDTQKQQIQTIFSSTEAQGKAIHHDESLSEDDRREKMMAIMKDSGTQSRALLTPEQQATFDTMPPPGRRGHPKGDGEGDAPPPPKPQ